MTMPSEILWDYLVNTQAIFTDPDGVGAWPLYVNELPDGHDVSGQAACVADTTGVLDGKDMRGTLTQHYGIQIRTRAKDDTTAYDKLQALEAALASVTSEEITLSSGILYRINNISQTSSIVRLGSDDKGRSGYTINFLLSVTQI